ncbi:uncharacterized protein LOC128729044 [Anopheles nili]|uniref:uncharacterized protein LOC128729044 n=1 Tax=Anopheles nili TaxID=185578 RepID=UPI00237BCF21|nr:uncharacterized protein LOC128729044 [Anopheles nili]
MDSFIPDSINEFRNNLNQYYTPESRLNSKLRLYKQHRGLLQGEVSRHDISRGDHPLQQHHNSLLEFEDKTSEKNLLKLQDLFEIALTTLAYLSFGMFILQVIMCITMTKTDSSVMILPTTSELEVEDEERRRNTRELPFEDITASRDLNQLIKHVLISMNAPVNTEKDDHNCLLSHLCKINKKTRIIKDIKHYWKTMLSFGICWLSTTRFLSWSSSSFAMKCMNAALTGLGNGKCFDLQFCPGP